MLTFPYFIYWSLWCNFNAVNFFISLLKKKKKKKKKKKPLL
ncbi:hypothetical protein HanIR_Chr08g0363051 [Helianthus annuus]|nr:hypothetical protein HanIR_Chr08g0363051 [Helianthus annuus]